MVWKLFEKSSANKATVTCGVSQGSILGPSLLLLYENDLNHATKVINPIMIADGANLFFTHSNINALLEKINEELTKITNYFNAIKLSLNVKKT